MKTEDFYLKQQRDIIRWILFAGVISTLFSLFSSIPFLCIPTFVVAIVLVKLFWTSPLTVWIVAGFAWQLLQISVKVLLASFGRGELEGDYGQSIFVLRNAYLFACPALVVYMFGINSVIKNIYFNTSELEQWFQKLRVDNVIKAYVISLFLYLIFGGISSIFYNLRTILIQLMSFRWIFFILLVSAGITQKKHLSFICLCVAFEVILGFSSYFSEFKKPLFYVLLVFLTLYGLPRNSIPYYLSCFLFLFCLASMWTGIKSEYRAYLSDRAKNQSVNVSNMDAIKRLYQITLNYSWDSEHANSFFHRINYIDFLSLAMENVPKNVPIQYGTESIKVIQGFVPRFLNPNKAVLDDSLDLMKYIPIQVASGKDGASIGMGYLAYLYVDWGIIYVWLFILILGLIWGIAIRYVLALSPSIPMGVLELLPLFWSLYLFETSLAKNIQGLTMYVFLICVLNLLVGKKIERFLMGNNRNDS